MRPLYIYLRARFFPPKPPESLDSDRTLASQLEWFSPPTSTPWYKRIFHAPAPTDKPDGIPDVKSSTSTPEPKMRWPQRLEKPENVTWAKDQEPKMSDSFDLPLQGIRKSEGSSEEEEGEKDVFGAWRYHRGWG